MHLVKGKRAFRDPIRRKEKANAGERQFPRTLNRRKERGPKKKKKNEYNSVEPLHFSPGASMSQRRDSHNNTGKRES